MPYIQKSVWSLLQSVKEQIQMMHMFTKELYDLAQVIKPFLVQKVQKQKNNAFKIQNQIVTNFNKPSWLTTILMSFKLFGQGRTNYEENVSSSFWQMKCNSPLSEERCKINGTQYGNIFNAVKSVRKSMQISEAISFSAFGKTYGREKYLGSHKPADYQTDYLNSVYGLASQELLDSKLFNQTLNRASVISNPPTKKVFLFSLKQDSVVPVKNTYNYKLKHGNQTQTYYFDNKKYVVCPLDEGEHSDVDHNYAQILANLFALSYIKGVADN